MLAEPAKQSAIGWFRVLPPNLTEATAAALKFYFK